MLTLDGLTLTYNGESRLDSVSLTLAPGDILGVVGNSGSGKSNLSRLLAGALPKRGSLTGQVSIDSHTLSGDDLRGLGKIPREDLVVVSDICPRLLRPHRLIGQQLAEAVQARDGTDPDTAQAVAQSLCERVGLLADDDLGNKRPAQLSRGATFLAEMAYALALRPKVLVADDPNFALDLLQQAQVLDALRQQADQDALAVLYLTRNLPAAARIANEIAVISGGAIVERDQTDRLLRAAQHTETDALVRAAVHRRRAVPRQVIPRARPVLSVKDAVLDDKRRTGGPFSRRQTLRHLDKVSFEIGQKECVGVIGVSRQGLTRLCDVVCGEIALNEGRVILSGARVTPDMDASQKRRVQRVGPNPFEAGKDRQSVTEFMEETLQPQVLSAFERDLKIGEVLGDFGLPRALAGQKMGGLDAITRQQLAFARAVLARPDLIVFEEPTAWLDLPTGDSFLDLMAAMQARHGFSALLVSRGFHILRALAHRVVVLDGGRVIESGETDKVFRHPEAQHTAALVDAQPILSDVLVTH